MDWLILLMSLDYFFPFQLHHSPLCRDGSTELHGKVTIQLSDDKTSNSTPIYFIINTILTHYILKGLKSKLTGINDARFPLNKSQNTGYDNWSWLFQIIFVTLLPWSGLLPFHFVFEIIMNLRGEWFYISQWYWILFVWH